MPLPPIAMQRDQSTGKALRSRKRYGFRLSRRYRFWFCRRSYSLCRRLNLERRLGYRFFHSRFRRRLLPEYRRWFRQFRHNRRHFSNCGEFHRRFLWIGEFHSAQMSGIEPLMKRRDSAVFGFIESDHRIVTALPVVNPGPQARLRKLPIRLR